MTVVKTLLYVPADRPDRVRKALASGSDGVIVDLEDAVAPSHKDVARAGLAEVLSNAFREVMLQVRVNAAGTTWHDADLDAVAALPGHIGIRLPKCESPQVVAAIHERMPGRDLHLIVESALGVERAFGLATAPGVCTLGLGEADLRADLGVQDDDELLWARARVVNAAAAAGLPAPMLSVFTNVHDLAGLRESCLTGRRLGFVGRTAIHPRQLSVITEAFTPTSAEVAAAREVLAAAEAGQQAGTGAIALPDGRFVDEAVVRQAHRTLALIPSEWST